MVAMKRIIAALAALIMGATVFAVASPGTADNGVVHAQLSASFDQYGGGVVEFDQVDSIAGATFDPATDAVTVEEAGLYLIVAAPQVGNIQNPGATGSANFWIAVNGTDVANSNVTYQHGGRNGDVIVSQGVGYLQLGDAVTVEWSTTGPALEAITTPGEPLTPSVIFTLVKIG